MEILYFKGEHSDEVLISRHTGEKKLHYIIILKNESVTASLLTSSVVSYTSCVLELRSPHTSGGQDNHFYVLLVIIMRKVVTDKAGKYISIFICSNGLFGDAFIIIPPFSSCVYSKSVFIGGSPEGWQRKAVRCAFTVCQQTWITNGSGTNYWFTSYARGTEGERSRPSLSSRGHLCVPSSRLRRAQVFTWLMTAVKHQRKCCQ